MIREYLETDKELVKKFIRELQSYLIEKDSDRLLKPFSDDGEEYFQNLLKSIDGLSGKIFICEEEGNSVGFVAGYIEEIDKVDELMSVIKKPGYVAELFVEEQCRGKGYGKALMAKMEEFFCEAGCDVVTVTVDAFNADTRKMYESVGYGNRDILMMKKLI